MSDMEKTLASPGQTLKLPSVSPRPHLIVLYPQALFRQIPIPKGRSVLGRGAEADIRFDDELISRKHCELSWDGATVHIRDLGSTNGTFVDGSPVQEMALDSENRLQIGKMVLKIDFKDPSEEAFDRELFEAATTDPLTRIPNRRTFMDRSLGECAAARRANHFVHAILVDADHFKRVNDTWGHQAGDMVLREIARILKTEKRESDLLARYGGEEFVLLLAGISREDALKSAERLRSAVERHHFAFNDTPIPVTISLGLASREGKDIPAVETLVAEADRFLYMAKENGRNRVYFVS